MRHKYARSWIVDLGYMVVTGGVGALNAAVGNSIVAYALEFLAGFFCCTAVTDYLLWAKS
jgi:hypothetical protein